MLVQEPPFGLALHMVLSVQLYSAPIDRFCQLNDILAHHLINIASFQICFFNRTTKKMTPFIVYRNNLVPALDTALVIRRSSGLLAVFGSTSFVDFLITGDQASSLDIRDSEYRNLGFLETALAKTAKVGYQRLIRASSHRDRVVRRHLRSYHFEPEQNLQHSRMQLVLGGDIELSEHELPYGVAYPCMEHGFCLCCQIDDFHRLTRYMKSNR